MSKAPPTMPIITFRFQYDRRPQLPSPRTFNATLKAGDVGVVLMQDSTIALTNDDVDGKSILAMTLRVDTDRPSHAVEIDAGRGWTLGLEQIAPTTPDEASPLGFITVNATHAEYDAAFLRIWTGPFERGDADIVING